MFFRRNPSKAVSRPSSGKQSGISRRDSLTLAALGFAAPLLPTAARAANKKESKPRQSRRWSAWLRCLDSNRNVYTM